tara:strand:+ start:38847 stop:40052 length:1206 start_codon:yes stop_codon:yes gene_type:complete
LHNFKRLKHGGTHIQEVTTVFPSLTYPSHTSMITGVLPKDHGIIHNTLFDSTAKFKKWYWYSDSIRTPTVFNLAKEKDLVTAGVSWSVSVGGPFNYLVPEIKSESDDISTLQVVRKHDKPWWLIEYFALSGKLDVGDDATEGFTRDLNLHKMFKTLFRKKLPHLTGYHIIQTDFHQHDYGKNSQEAFEAYMFADSLIGSVLNLITELNQWDYTTVIVTGDHGFVDHNTRINLNALLVENGFINVQEDGTVKDWNAFCHSAGGSAFIRLKNPNDDKTKGKLKKLLEESHYWEFFNSDELPEVCQNYIPAEFVLISNPGYYFTRVWESQFLEQINGGSHGGDPSNPELKTTFFAIGRRIEEGVVLEKMHITQVAAVIAELLDLPLNTSSVPHGLLTNPQALQK